MISLRNTTIVTIIGLMRYWETMMRVYKDKSLKGNIVLLPVYDKFPFTKSDLNTLSNLHYSKIEICDECLIVNVNGYMGADTIREKDYAIKLGKNVRYLEEPK